MKSTLLTLAASLFIAGSSFGALSVGITSSTTGAQFFLSGGGTLVPDGSLVVIGTFASAPAANASFETLKLAFTEYGRTTFTHAGAPNSGRFTRTGLAESNADPTIDDTDFTGKDLYMWVYSTPTESATAQQGIFTSVANANWNFAASVDPPANTTTAGIATIDTAIGAFIGGTQAGLVRNGATLTGLTLAAPVPEPSTALMMLMGLSAFSYRRRK